MPNIEEIRFVMDFTGSIGAPVQQWDGMPWQITRQGFRA
jgi:hypothetical protein